MLSSHPQRAKNILLPSLLVLGALLLPWEVSAQARRKKPIAQDKDELRANVLKARPPSRGLVVDSTEGQKPGKEGGSGVVGEVKDLGSSFGDSIVGWHTTLARYMPGPLAWLVLCLPLIVLLLLVLRSRRKVRKGAAAGGKKGKAKGKNGAAGGADGLVPSRKHKTEEIVPLKLTPPERLLINADGEQAAIHETFVILGADDNAIRALRPAAASGLDAATWAAALSDMLVTHMRVFRSRWVRAVAVQRVERWLAEHPLVTSSGLQVYMPTALEHSELDALTLTFISGIRAPLIEAQEGLVKQARRSLEQIYNHSDDPYILITAREESEVPQSLAPLDSDKDAPPTDKLAMLLYGLVGLEHLAQCQSVEEDTWAEFRKAIDEHNNIVDTPVPAEGIAVHFLHEMGRPPLEGIGTMMAAVVGAAYSLSSVYLQIGKLSSTLASLEQQNLFTRLGKMLSPAISNRKSKNGPHLVKNLRRMLGLNVLQAECKRSADLVRSTERLVAKEPLWEDGTAETISMDVILVHLHRSLVTQLLEHAQVAERRLWEILEMLAHEGKAAGSQQNAHLRIGYTLGAFGMECLRSMSTDILSLGRETEISVRELSKK